MFLVYDKKQGHTQVFFWPEAYTIFGTLFKKRIQNYKYKVRYESEYLFRAHPRALEGACASEAPC